MKNVPRVAVVYDRRKRANIHSPQPVELRITIGSKQTFHNTGVRLLPNEWKIDQVVNRPDAYELNERISIMRRRVEKELNRQMDEGSVINLKLIDFQHVNSESFLDFFEERIQKRAIKDSTRGRYKVTLDFLKDWGEIVYFHQVTRENIHKLEDELERRHLKQSTKYAYHKHMKAIINDAMSFSKIQKNPYDCFRGKIKRDEKEVIEYLTEEELHLLENADIQDPYYIKIRDMFLFQCYTGLPYSDMQKFDISQYTFEDGKYYKMNKRTKTEKPFMLQLLSPAVKILEKYDMKVPKMDNSTYNKALKALALIVGIKQKLHTHMGRSTFATFMLSHGTPLHVVSRMLGHKTVIQTQKYADVLATNVRSEYDKIDELFK